MPLRHEDGGVRRESWYRAGEKILGCDQPGLSRISPCLLAIVVAFPRRAIEVAAILPVFYWLDEQFEYIFVEDIIVPAFEIHLGRRLARKASVAGIPVEIGVELEQMA